MKTWILIVMMYYNRSGFTAEFTSKEKCETAGQAAIAMDGGSYRSLTKYICVEK